LSEGNINNNNDDNDELTDSFVRGLNTMNGALGGIYHKVVQHVLRNGGIERNKENLAKGEHPTNLTAGQTNVKWGDD
jgi:hypothetical protein